MLQLTSVKPTFKNKNRILLLHIKNEGDGGTPEFVLSLDNGDIITFSQGSNGTFQLIAQGTAALQIAKDILIQSGLQNVDIGAPAGKLELQGVNIKIIAGGTVEINGTMFIQGGAVVAKTATIGGMVIPPNVI